MKIAILGGRGRLGATLIHRWRGRYELLAPTREQLDLADGNQVREFAANVDAEVVINTAGITQLEICEDQPEAAFAINARAPELLAQGLAARGIPLLHFSTDYVFDGSKDGLYVESDAAEPISVYGKSKRAGEIAVLAAAAPHWVFRVSWLFDGEKKAFPDQVLEQARERERVEAIVDKRSVPTSCRDIADWMERLISRLPTTGGLYHVCSAGSCTWLEYAQAVLDAASDQPLRCRTVSPIALADVPFFRAPRPLNSAMDSAKFFQLIELAPPDWRSALTKALRGGTNS